MVAKQFSDIIQRFLMKEINKIIAKYSKVSNENIEVVEELIKLIEDYELKDELYKDFDNTLKIAKELEEEYVEDRADIISMYLGIKNNTELKISLKEVVKYYYDLKDNDYIFIDGSHLIYKKGSNLKSFTRVVLENIIDDEWHIDRLLDKDTIISYWIEGVTKDEAIDEIVADGEIEDILSLDPVTVFENEIDEYLYSEVEV
ncbi:Uncharacterised protein [uncultured Clostridium sp.]|uniref:hypothetical protein n=1 Tax=uncultured Clostridium sp. TaxID=59620 RepID=UPI000822C176|nr:hypothetical protein [uncultured Clostridium sp.]SCK02032.1 Uncharacterised protein [uncultured Clostridium sp.]